MPMRVGIGYDVHRLVPGRRLVLGGVLFPGEVGLEGHSDADVLIHALMDSLLGAAGEPDIGHFFPNSDPQWAGRDSSELLALVLDHLRARGWRVINVDITVLAERPRLSPQIPTMKARLAQLLGIKPEKVGIKATTNETLGFIGRGEGIAALAVSLLRRRQRWRRSR